MSYTFIGKYKICHSIFVILGTILMKKSLAEKMINEAGLGQINKQKDKKKKKSTAVKSKKLKPIMKKKRFFGGHRRRQKNKDKGLDKNDSFKSNKDSFFQKLPEESKTSSEFSRFKSLMGDTVVIESEKNSKFKNLKRLSDSVQSLEITQSNDQKDEEKKIQIFPNIENQNAVEQTYKFSTFAVKQQYGANINKKGEKAYDFRLIDSSILEKDSEMESF